MSEPNENFWNANDELRRMKPIVTVLWIGLITAIIITIIDWKIKTDILRIANGFYKERQNGQARSENEPDNQYSNSGGRSSAAPVLPFSGVDSNSRMEETDVSESSRSVDQPTKKSDDEPANWDEFLNPNGRTFTGTTGNHPTIPPRSFGPSK
jgi:hypothetical protein